MLINSKESLLEFPNEEPDNSSSIMETLMLNPVKYREFKRDINRINNIDNEINFIKSQQMFNQTNFLKTIIITKEDYEKSLQIVNDITNKLSEEEVTDIISHRKLISVQKRIMEIYSYLIGFKYFDWKLFREKFNLYEAKVKMSSVNYNQLEKKKINSFLNKLCDSHSNSLDKLPQNMSTDYGIDIICEWVRNQLKIYIYLLQNNILIKKQTKKTSDDSSQIKQTNSSMNTQKAIELNGCRKINLNDNFQIRKTSNILTKVQLDNSNIISPKSPKSENSCDNYIINNNIKSIKNSVVQSNKDSTQFDEIKSNKNELLVTALPDINHQNNTNTSNNHIIPLNNIKVNDDNSTIREPKCEIKNSFIFLKGFDYEREHIKKEERIMEYLPLLKYRTFHQMRTYYGIQAKINKKLEKKHFDELKMSSFNDKKNNNKILNMISNKKIGILDKIPYFRLKQILEQN